MRAITHNQFADATTVLQVEDIAVPTPGPGQIRVRMLLSAIHNHDLMTIEGTYGQLPELPSRAGTEAVGIIEELGEGVTGLEVGQRVQAGALGAWADQYIAYAAGATPVPDDVSDESAAQLLSMPMSAIALVDFVKAEPGQWVVQNAANGAVGRYFAQLAEARGIHVLGLVRREESVRELAEAGIKNVVSVDAPDWREQALALIGDGEVASAIDSVGGESTGQISSLLSKGGEIVVFGAMGSMEMSLPIGDVLFRGVTVRGFWGAEVMPALSPEQRTAYQQELIERVRSGALLLPVDGIYPLEQIAEAVTASRRPGRVGKVLLRGA